MLIKVSELKVNNDSPLREQGHHAFLAAPSKAARAQGSRTRLDKLVHPRLNRQQPSS